MVTLLDIPAFTPLRPLCNRFRIDFELYGGAVARLIEHIGGAEPTLDNLRNVDLFTLAPGFADLDVTHTGPPELSGEIVRTILDEIPNAECVRWELRSRSEALIYRTAAYFNNRIPTRAMSLSTDPKLGFKDPLNGRDDIKQQNYRYERNVLYTDSPLYKQMRDLELFSSLIYFRALFESALNPDLFSRQAGFLHAAQVISEARTLHTIVSLQESAYLRSRLYYILASIAAASPPDASIIFKEMGLTALLDFIAGWDMTLGERLRSAADGPRMHAAAAISAARIGGDIYRTPNLTGPWLQNGDAHEAILDVLKSGQHDDTLGDGEVVVAASLPLLIAGGPSPSSAPVGSARERAALVQEFMYVNLNLPTSIQPGWRRLPVDANHSYAEEDLTLLLAVRPAATSRWTIHAMPCFVTLRHSHILISVNTFGLLEELSSGRSASMQLFLVGWKG